MKRFTMMVNESVNSGYNRGLSLFMENLELEINKDLLIESQGLPETILTLMEQNDRIVSDTNDIRYIS